MTIQDLLKDAYREGMTVDEIATALAGIDLPTDGSAEIERLKNALSKSNSEAADYKKQLREKMSADERKTREDAERLEELQAKYDALVRESTVSKNKARLLALGYDDALATETAEAMASGDLDKVFTNQKRHQDAVEKRIREEVLTSTPRPTGGEGSKTITKEAFSKMPLNEQYKFAKEHPEEYKKLYGGN